MKRVLKKAPDDVQEPFSMVRWARPPALMTCEICFTRNREKSRINRVMNQSDLA